MTSESSGISFLISAKLCPRSSTNPSSAHSVLFPNYNINAKIMLLGYELLLDRITVFTNIMTVVVKTFKIKVSTYTSLWRLSFIRSFSGVNRCIARASVSSLKNQNITERNEWKMPNSMKCDGKKNQCSKKLNSS